MLVRGQAGQIFQFSIASGNSKNQYRFKPKTELVRRQTVSRVLYSIALARNRAAIIHLGSGFPRNSSGLPGNIERAVHSTLRRHVSLFGLAPCGVYRADPLPDRWCALTAPFHPCLCLAAI